MAIAQKKGAKNKRRKPLSEAQVRAATAILLGIQSIDQIAAEIGVTSRTIKAWQADPRFQELVEEMDLERAKACKKAIRDLVQRSIRKLQVMLNQPGAGDLRPFDLIALVDRLSRYLPDEPTEAQRIDAGNQLLDELEAILPPDLWQQVNACLIDAAHQEVNGSGIRSD